jgi:hypothetical protein
MVTMVVWRLSLASLWCFPQKKKGKGDKAKKNDTPYKKRI